MLLIKYIAKPMLCQSLQCYHCLFESFRHYCFVSLDLRYCLIFNLLVVIVSFQIIFVSFFNPLAIIVITYLVKEVYPQCTHRLAYLCWRFDGSLDMKLALVLVVARNERWMYPLTCPLLWMLLELPKIPRPLLTLDLWNE